MRRFMRQTAPLACRPLRACLLVLAMSPAAVFPAAATPLQSPPDLLPTPRIESVTSDAGTEFLGWPTPTETTLDHRSTTSIIVTTLEAVGTEGYYAQVNGVRINVPFESIDRCAFDGFHAVACPSGVRPNVRQRTFVLPPGETSQFNFVAITHDWPPRMIPATIQIR